MKESKIEVTKEYLENILQSCKEFKTHGCTYAEIYELNKIIKNTKYYLTKIK